MGEAIGAWGSPLANWVPDMAYGKGFAVALGQLYGSVVGRVGSSGLAEIADGPTKGGGA